MKLIILDRDGVINHDSDDYIKSESEWIPIAGSLEAIASLSQNEYHVVVVSNQSGIGRGLFTIEDLNRIHQKMMAELALIGGKIDAIFFCPHTPEDQCDCRKPRPGLFTQIKERLKTPLNNVIYVGDKLADIKVAEAVDAVPVLVRTGYGQKTIDDGDVPEDIQIYDDLASVVTAILDEE